jgi:hemolysin activation/secretion protein
MNSYMYYQGMVKSTIVSIVIILTGLLFADNVFCKDILPQIPITNNEVETIKRGESIYIQEYIITGNTVLPESVLHNIATSYSKRDVSFAELSELRDELTLAYVERGYVSSGAILKLEQFSNSVLPIEIVEGVIAKINIKNNGRLNDSFIRQRIIGPSKDEGQSEIVNLNVLEERLQLLLQKAQIDSLQSELLPSANRGESILMVDVQENYPLSGAIEISNYESPAVGEERIMLMGEHNNLSGFGDSLALNLRKSQGLTEWSLSYALPVTSNDLALYLDIQQTKSKLIEKPFESLDMESKLSTYRLGFDYPLIRTAFSSLRLFASVEKRNSESFLLGDPFSFNTWEEEGEAKITVLRLGQSWGQRGRQRAFELRSTISIGIDDFDTDISNDDVPDGEFVSLFLQLQWAQRLDWFNSQLIARADIQFADSALLGMEKFILGGHNSVRGYRENAIIGDGGALARIEWHVPVIPSLASSLVLVPFIDGGFVQNKYDKKPKKSLSSLGFGILWELSKNIQLNLHLAHGLTEQDDLEDLLDTGLQFRLLGAF